MSLRPYLLFGVLVCLLSTYKTICLAGNYAQTQSATAYVLEKDANGRRFVYPTIAGSDLALPFSSPVEVAARTVGTSKLIYAVYPGTSIRNSLYPSFWR